MKDQINIFVTLQGEYPDIISTDSNLNIVATVIDWDRINENDYLGKLIPIIQKECGNFYVDQIDDIEKEKSRLIQEIKEAMAVNDKSPDEKPTDQCTFTFSRTNLDVLIGAVEAELGETYGDHMTEHKSRLQDILDQLKA